MVTANHVLLAVPVVLVPQIEILDEADDKTEANKPQLLPPPNKQQPIMTINIYPEIVRKQDLSPDEGFGPDIDDACNVRHMTAAC